MAWKRPASNSAVTPRRAAKRPNCLTTLLTVMALVTMSGCVERVEDSGCRKRSRASDADGISASLVRHPGRGGGLGLRHALGRLGGLRSVRRRAGLFGRVLRGALGLKCLGVENAVVADAAIGQGLRIVFESIGRGFGAGVVDGQSLRFVHQHELD